MRLVGKCQPALAFSHYNNILFIFLFSMFKARIKTLANTMRRGSKENHKCRPYGYMKFQNGVSRAFQYTEYHRILLETFWLIYLTVCGSSFLDICFVLFFFGQNFRDLCIIKFPRFRMNSPFQNKSSQPSENQNKKKHFVRYTVCGQVIPPLTPPAPIWNLGKI